jgi:Sulfotransferase family
MRVLVIGAGRSGTTWVGNVLGRTAGTDFLNEPDDPTWQPFASRAGRGRGIFPVVRPGEPAPATMIRLWDAAFGAPVRYLRGQDRVARKLFFGVPSVERRKITHPDRSGSTMRLRFAGALAVPRHHKVAPRNHVVKTVRMQFALEWIYERWQPAVVVCRRHPLDVIASRLALGLEHRLELLAPEVRAYALDHYGVRVPTTDDPVIGMSFIVGLLMALQNDGLRAHPEFHVVDHETLCVDPIGEFRMLTEVLGLEWTPWCEDFVVESNRPGVRYELRRVASEQPGRWRHRLSADDARTAARVVDQFPLGRSYDMSVA